MEAKGACGANGRLDERPMKLVLDDGTTFHGRSFGAHIEVQGEVVFNTGMTGYVETLTDPSYCGQILVLTYPLQNNYGVPEGPYESQRIQVQGLVVSRYSDRHSHHAAVRSLGEWLVSHGVPAVQGVDTRMLTRRLREHGTIGGMLLFAESDPEEARARTMRVQMKDCVARVVWREVVRFPGGDPRVLVIDTGVKENILRSLRKRGAAVIVAGFQANWEPLLDEVDGVLIGNGPGDPADLAELVERIRRLLSRNLPVFGICLGHQLLALAAGAKTYKLKYGHRSQNQPVMEVATGRSFITSQNHGYAVSTDNLPADWSPWFVNLNDETNEGIRHRYRPLFSVQFHPEAAAGPHDTEFLFDEFLATIRAIRRGAAP